MPGSVVVTDEYRAYAKLSEKEYDHLSVNHSGGEYASGSDNEMHTDNCECCVGLKLRLGENMVVSANSIWSHA